MSLVLPSPIPVSAPEIRVAKEGADRKIIAAAVWHALLWLVIANAAGVLLAAMLLFPEVNSVFGEWTYGRWMPVHLNLQLYGWCSLPLVAFLFKVYGADREPAAVLSNSTLLIWSSALAAGVISWLQGHSSGKLFLDWTGYTRILFPLALLSLWSLLAWSFTVQWTQAARRRTPAMAARLIGLLFLLLIPFILYVAASPSLYPPINPDTGGPTGASQLESTLVIIAILLLLPFGLAQRVTGKGWPLRLAWAVLVAEALLCLGLGRADVSHHRAIQWMSLGSLLIWIPLTPAYYSAFRWHPNTRMWRIAFLCWWSVLVPTGWMLFLPGILDHFKFTDGLVGHSLLAMAGFVSSLLIFVMVQLLGDDGWIFNARWSFLTWHLSVVLYAAIMFFAGWREGSDPAFSFMPGVLRNGIYGTRLLLGLLILIASADWFFWSFDILQKPARQLSGDTI